MAYRPLQKLEKCTLRYWDDRSLGDNIRRFVERCPLPSIVLERGVVVELTRRQDHRYDAKLLRANNLKLLKDLSAEHIAGLTLACPIADTTFRELRKTVPSSIEIAKTPPAHE